MPACTSEHGSATRAGLGSGGRSPTRGLNLLAGKLGRLVARLTEACSGLDSGAPVGPGPSVAFISPVAVLATLGLFLSPYARGIGNSQPLVLGSSVVATVPTPARVGRTREKAPVSSRGCLERTSRVLIRLERPGAGARLHLVLGSTGRV